jgi:cell division protein FtsB
MDDYPYATLRSDGWLRCDGLHRPDFPTLLRDVLHYFTHTRTPMYRGLPYHEFGYGRCGVHVDIPAHPSDPGMTAWFTTATGDDLDDTLEKAAHQALTEFCECHLLGLVGTAIALFPIQNEGNTAWSKRLAAVGNPEHSAYHVGWAFMACYAQHMSSMFQEVVVIGAYQRLRLKEYNHQVSSTNRIIKDIQKGNRELLQENHRLEARIKELNDELMRTYHSRHMKLDFLDDARTRLKSAQDELVAAQGYIHHLEIELHKRDEQLKASQAQATEL